MVRSSIPSHVPPPIGKLAQGIADAARAELGPHTRVIWFGSWIAGTAVPRSDLDIAVDAGGPLPPADLQRLHDLAAALPTLHRIDLLDLNSIGQPLRDAILAEGVAL